MSRARYPLHELRDLLAPTATLRGVVVAVTDGVVEVATERGLRRAPAAGRTFTAGDRVSLREGSVYPAAQAARTYSL